MERKREKLSLAIHNRKMFILPEEIVIEILSPLPAKSLVRFQCVSKSWFALINDSSFIKMNLKNKNSERSLIVQTCIKKMETGDWRKDYYLVNFSNEYRFGESVKIFPPLYPYNHTSVIGSCNGLVCIHNHEYFGCNLYSDYEILIWNPSIRKYKKLPFEIVDNKNNRLHSAAFGYDSVNDDYKVLSIVVDEWEDKAPEIMVYSLKARSWRRVEDQWPYKELESMITSNPVFLNGAFHWLAESKTKPCTRTLLAFDLPTEKFGVQTVPFQSNSSMSLEVLGESLYACVSRNTVWIMKEYGLASSWSRLCTLPKAYGYGKSIVVSDDGGKILMEEYDFYGDLFWYDIKNKKRTFIENVEHISDKYWIASCLGSLLLLDGDSEN